MLKKFELLLIIVIFIVLCTGCTVTNKVDGKDIRSTHPSVEINGKGISSEATSQIKQISEKKIGLSVFDLSNPYFVHLANGAKNKAEALGLELIVKDPKSDTSKQLEQIREFSETGCDAIIVCALDPNLVTPTLKQAKEKGIKIIAQSMDTDIRDIFVSADEWDMGHTIGIEAGKWIMEKLNGEAEVAILAWDKIPQQRKRKKGMIDGIKAISPNAKIVAVEDANTPALGGQAADKLLKAYPNLKVICGVNDSAVISALTQVEAAGRATNDFFIGGIDATPEALEKIKQGTVLRATVDNIPYDNGKMDVEFASRLIDGEKLPEIFVVPVKAITEKNIK